MAGNISENPPRTEVPSTPEEFIEVAFKAAIKRYSEEEGAEVIATVKDLHASNWNSQVSHPGQSPVQLPADIIKGVIIRQGSFLRGFVLSNRHGTIHDNTRERSFQFGIERDLGREIDWTDSRDLRIPFFNDFGVWAAGELYYDEKLDKLKTDGWADRREFGGVEFGSWKSEDQLSGRGLESVANFVDRTFRTSTVMENANSQA